MRRDIINYKGNGELMEQIIITEQNHTNFENLLTVWYCLNKLFLIFHQPTLQLMNELSNRRCYRTFIPKFVGINEWKF